VLAVASSLPVAATIRALGAHIPSPTPALNVLMLFGFLSAFMTVASLFYSWSSRGARFAVAIGLLCTALYALLEGAWPAALVQTFFAVSMLRSNSFAMAIAPPRSKLRAASRRRFAADPARMTRMFGLN
jgi:hypothetical protein